MQSSLANGFFALPEKPHRCVIDRKKMFVALVKIVVEDGKETPQHYTLKSGETLIEETPPTGLKNQWTGKEWKELATPAEIEAAEKAEYESKGWPWPPEPPEPSDTEVIMVAVAEVYEKQLEQEEEILTTQLAIAELYETIGG